MTHRILLALLFSLVPCLLAGCGSNDKKGAQEGGQEHAHEHDHAETGPHNGHLVELAEPGKESKEEFHVEWDHKENGEITVWILDGKAKKEVPIRADSLFIDVKTGEMTESYELAAVDRTSGENASAFKFEIMSKALLGKLETVGKNVAATIRVDVNGKPYEGKFEAHAEHDHAGHKH
jgi:hypothetical protein